MDVKGPASNLLINNKVATYLLKKRWKKVLINITHSDRFSTLFWGAPPNVNPALSNISKVKTPVGTKETVAN
jgi:hypothetical protein